MDLSMLLVELAGSLNCASDSRACSDNVMGRGVNEPRVSLVGSGSNNVFGGDLDLEPPEN